MSAKYPMISIQSDWNEVIKLPNSEAWISAKYLNENGVHDKLTTTINKSDGKIKVNFSDNYQYVSHTNLSLIVKHTGSGLKVAFVAPTKIHKVHNNSILSVAAAENALAVSSCEGDKHLIWDSRAGEIIFNLKEHVGPVYKCRFFPSGLVVLSAGADTTCRVVCAQKGICPVILSGHTMAVNDFSIIDKGRNIISVSKDGVAKLWDVGEKRSLGIILQGHGPINCCDIATTTDVVTVENEREVGTGNKLIVVGCETGQVVCAHVARRQELFCIQLDSACNACIIVEGTIIVGCSNGEVVQLSLQDGSLIKKWHESANSVLSMATLPNKMFIAGRQDGNCTVLSLQETHNSIRVQLTGADCDGIRDISFNGKWIFTACRDSFIRKYDFNQIIVHFK